MPEVETIDASAADVTCFSAQSWGLKYKHGSKFVRQQIGHFTDVEMGLGIVIYEKCTFSIFLRMRLFPPEELFLEIHSNNIFAL